MSCVMSVCLGHGGVRNAAELGRSAQFEDEGLVRGVWAFCVWLAAYI